MVSKKTYMSELTHIFVELPDLFSLCTKTEQQEIFLLTDFFMKQKKEDNYSLLSNEKWEVFLSDCVIRIQTFIEHILKQNHFFSKKELVTILVSLKKETNMLDKINQLNQILKIINYTK